jgi:hypothetical protein
MRKIIIRCLFKKNGCKEILTLENLENHEKSYSFDIKICEKCLFQQSSIHDCIKSLL